jgi:hypothetical protein
MLTPEQIEQAAESAGIVETPALFYSQGWRGVAPDDMEAFARAIYAQALKDAAEVCGKLEEEELCLDVSSDEGKHGYAHERLAQAAAAILALGEENP